MKLYSLSYVHVHVPTHRPMREWGGEIQGKIYTTCFDLFILVEGSRGFVRIFATYPFLLKQDIHPYTYMQAELVQHCLNSPSF